VAPYGGGLRGCGARHPSCPGIPARWPNALPLFLPHIIPCGELCGRAPEESELVNPSSRWYLLHSTQSTPFEIISGAVESLVGHGQMNSLTHIEKQKLERELGMDRGYVLDFSNRTFEEFFREVVGVAIYDQRYALGSGSKANRMRAFWREATDSQLQACFQGMLDGWDIYSRTPMNAPLRELIRRIVRKCGGGAALSEEPTDEQAVAVDSGTLDKLMSELLRITALPAHTRGYAYESFLKGMFNAYRLSARASFRLTGEQIDGSFVLHHEVYLLEAKWQNPKVGAADLHTFHGKLSEKADWSRGLFVSNSGFAEDGLHAFGRGKKVVCMDGFDMSEMLRRRLSIVAVIDAKVRRAAETGNPFASVRELFP
jgi:hypothetical protein